MSAVHANPFDVLYSFLQFLHFLTVCRLIPCEPDQARTDKLIFLEFKLGEKSHDYSLLIKTQPDAIRHTHYFCLRYSAR
jgi:hypothetical protein